MIFEPRCLRWAKGDNEHAKYTVSSVIFVAQVVCVFIGWALAHSSGGVADFKKCFDAWGPSKEPLASGD